MPTVRDVLDALDQIAPPEYAFARDRIGLQVGDEGAAVDRAVVSLDSSREAVAHAQATGAQLLVSHHPVIFEPLSALPFDSRAADLAAAGISFIAAHTNWDCAPGGINDALAARLGLVEPAPFGTAEPERRFKLVTFVPTAQRDTLIDALSQAGAGVIGAYERCAFFHPGTGTFHGGGGTSPVVGQAGRTEHTPEDRLEMLVPAARAQAVEQALRQVHPYEEPAYDLFVLREGPGARPGRIGVFPAPMKVEALIAHTDAALGTRTLAWGHRDSVWNLAVIGGAAGKEWRSAMETGADAFLTGEVPQHHAMEAAEAGFLVLAAGHYATEQPGCAALARRLSAAVPGVRFELFTPEPGRAGRPW